MREPRAHDRLALGVALLAAAGFGWYFAMVHAGVQRWDLASLEALSERRGIAPMQYRYLLPGLVWLARHHGVGMLPTIGYDEWESFFDQVGVLGIWAGTVWLLRTTLRQSLGACGLMALLPLPALLVHYVTLRADYFYVYDIPSVAFFTLGLAASLARKRVALVVLFVIGALNRESMLFVALADLVVWGTHPGERRAAILRCVGLVAVWAAMKAGLLHVFRDSVDPSYSGVLWKSVIERNLDNVRQDTRVVARYWSSVFAYWWIPVFALFAQIRGTAIGRAMLIVPPFWALMLFVGLLEEVRIFGELLPAVFCALMLLVQKQSLRGRAEPLPSV